MYTACMVAMIQSQMKRGVYALGSVWMMSLFMNDDTNKARRRLRNVP